MPQTRNASDLERALGELIEADLDAIENYYSAIGRLINPTDRLQFGRFVEDHRRHVADLTELLCSYGDGGPIEPDLKQWLTKGLTKSKVVFMSLAGDLGVLEAMRANEALSVRTYEFAKTLSDLPTPVRAVVERNLSDELRQHAWIEKRLAVRRASKEQVRHA